MDKYGFKTIYTTTVSKINDDGTQEEIGQYVEEFGEDNDP